MVKPTVLCLRCQRWLNQPLLSYQLSLDIPCGMFISSHGAPPYYGYSRAQGGKHSLTVGTVASLLSLTGLTMDPICSDREQFGPWCPR
jgi:hypothetical protein